VVMLFSTRFLCPVNRGNLKTKLPPRRGDAEAIGSCLRVSASQRAILHKPISPSRRCRSHPSRAVPTSMRNKSRRGAETQRLLANVSASQRAILHQSTSPSRRYHSNPSHTVPTPHLTPPLPSRLPVFARFFRRPQPNRPGLHPIPPRPSSANIREICGYRPPAPKKTSPFSPHAHFPTLTPIP
jgi:hypothetical protein